MVRTYTIQKYKVGFFNPTFYTISDKLNFYFFDIRTALKDGDSGTHIPVFLFHSRMRNCYVSSYISSAD